MADCLTSRLLSHATLIQCISLKPIRTSLLFPLKPLCSPLYKSVNKFLAINAGLGGGNNNSKGLFRDPLYSDGSIPTDCPVPLEQQPINEYQSLLNTPLFSWPTMGPLNYGLRLAAIGIIVSALIGWPVSSITFNPKDEALQCVLGTVAGGQAAVILTTLRLYLGWAYVGNRLSSATIEYEESGWYDGQIWVKTPELLARDRLLASYKVKPPLSRLKSTLIGLAISLTFTSSSIFIFPSPSPVSSLPLDSVGANSLPSNTFNRTYSQGSAQTYEPEGFMDDDNYNLVDSGDVDDGNDDDFVTEDVKMGRNENSKPTILDHMRPR